MTNDTIELPMACRCGKTEEERAAKSAEFLAVENKFKVAAGYKPEDDYPIFSGVVMGLEHEFKDSYYVDAIACDMWFLISVKSCSDPDTRIRIQCDRLEDGILAIWDYLYETYGMDDE